MPGESSIKGSSMRELARLEDVTVERVRCVGHGAADCATVLRWRQ
jgi:hypothetical protein